MQLSLCLILSCKSTATIHSSTTATLYVALESQVILWIGSLLFFTLSTPSKLKLHKQKRTKLNNATLNVPVWCTKSSRQWWSGRSTLYSISGRRFGYLHNCTQHYTTASQCVLICTLLTNDAHLQSFRWNFNGRFNISQFCWLEGRDGRDRPIR